jgi:hypothetical protein
MGKLLTILGVSEDVQNRLSKDVLMGEKLIDGLQKVYASSPDSGKKNQLALAISESVRLLLAKVQPYQKDVSKEVEIKKEEKKLPEEDKKPEEKKKKAQPKTETPPPPPEEPKSPHKSVDEPMTCEEIKEAIVGLTLLAKMGDDEAKDIIKQLKNKLKSQNCK